MTDHVLLVCGSRGFNDPGTVLAALPRFVDDPEVSVMVVHGGCSRGPDDIVHRYVTSPGRSGLEVRVMLADWEAHGKKAGPLRNQQMVDFAKEQQRAGAIVSCAAFWDGESKGTLDCVRRMVKAGLRVVVFAPGWAGK